MRNSSPYVCEEFYMINNKIKGFCGEEIAAEYLKKHDYVILERNYTTDVGEIDIIAAGEGFLVFVEVKERLNENYGYAAEAVGVHRQRKISQVASQYIRKYRRFDVPVRFDVIEIYLEEKRVNHIENAFDSYLRY